MTTSKSMMVYANRSKTKLDISRRRQVELTNPEVYVVAGETLCDPRTIRKFWAGQAVQNHVAIRLEPVMIRHGFLAPVAKPQTSAAR